MIGRTLIITSDFIADIYDTYKNQANVMKKTTYFSAAMDKQYTVFRHFTKMRAASFVKSQAV